jgi:hypothetical protein
VSQVVRVGQPRDPGGDLVRLAASAEGDACGLLGRDLVDVGGGQAGGGRL